MKISLETKIQGALAGVQADGTLMFTVGFNPAYAQFLHELDDPDPVSYASLCMLHDSASGKHVIMHWQTGFESFPTNGRYYCTRALYEANSSDVVDSDLSSLVSNLPQLKHFTSKEFDAAPLEISVDKAMPVAEYQGNALEKYMWCAIAAGKRILIRLEEHQDCADNHLLKDARLHSLMSALNAMPAFVRRNSSMGFSLKAKNASGKTGTFFDNLWIVAYHPDEKYQVDESNAILLDWKDGGLICNSSLAEYEALSDELKKAGSLIDNNVAFADWKQMCAAVFNAKQRVDQALAGNDYSILYDVYKKSEYRRTDVIKALLTRIEKQGAQTLDDVKLLNDYAKKSEAFDRLVVRTLQSSSVSAEVRDELSRLFKDRPTISSALGELKGKLSIGARYENFTNEIYSLTYEDLSLDHASDEEFVAIYQNGLLNGQYKGIDIKRIPNSDTFPSRLVKCYMKRNPRFILSDKNKSFIKKCNVADAAFMSWVFENKCVTDVEILIGLAECLEGSLGAKALEMFLALRGDKITCAELVGIKRSGKFDISVQEKLSAGKIPLGNLKSLCRDMSDKSKNEVWADLKTRQPLDLQEWEAMMDVFGKCSYPLVDAYFKMADQVNFDYQSVLRVYRKYSDESVRTFIEDQLAERYAVMPNDSELVHAVKEIGKTNKAFKTKVLGSLTDRMLSRKGAALGWLLAVINFILVIVLAIALISGDKEKASQKVEGDKKVAVTDTTGVDKGVSTDSLAIENINE